MTASIRLIAASGLALSAWLAQPSAAHAEECLQVPVACHVTSLFGPRYNPITKNFSSEYHRGVDFGCPIGTPVVAAGDAIVNIAGTSATAGNWVMSRTASGTPTVFKYMHHERNGVQSGETISKGEEIARTGNTGRSTGPHLHFQVESGGKAVDPMARFCSAPPLKPGVLQGADPGAGDILDPGSQAAAPPAGDVPPMGMDGSFTQILSDAIAARTANPDYARQLATLPAPRLLAELAYIQGLKLQIQQERSQHRERLLAHRAMLQLLMTEATLRPQLEAQRRAAAAVDRARSQ